MSEQDRLGGIALGLSLGVILGMLAYWGFATGAWPITSMVLGFAAFMVGFALRGSSS